MDPGMRDRWEPYRPPADERSRSESGDPTRCEAELWKRWRDGGELAARDALIARYRGYAKSLAARLFSRRSFNDVEFEEYHQLALLGLMEALDRFDPARGVKFKTFATPRIQGAIHNGLETLTERHQQIATRRRLASERTASLVPEHMALGDPEKLLAQLGDVAVNVALAFILDGIGLGTDAREKLPGNAYAETELSQVRTKLWQAVERLSDQEREVLDLHYRRGRRFEEIARQMALSKGRISQIHSQAVVRLRKLFSRAGLCDVAL
jgi:RNA polymerase sigma factor for flagellar operon FliA